MCGLMLAFDSTSEEIISAPLVLGHEVVSRLIGALCQESLRPVEPKEVPEVPQLVAPQLVAAPEGRVRSHNNRAWKYLFQIENQTTLSGDLVIEVFHPNSLKLQILSRYKIYIINTYIFKE